MDINILSAEDMIIGKLLWYKISESEKHFNDAKSILEIQGDKIDKQYILKWSIKLSFQEILKKIVG